MRGETRRTPPTRVTGKGTGNSATQSTTGTESTTQSTTQSTTGTESTTGKGARHHGNRHGRSEHAREAVLEAADDLLAERGLAGVTIEGIAARAGVAKQTIYRWWSSKVDILLDAFIQDMAEDLTPPDHGDLERDLRAPLAGQAQHDPQLAARLQGDYLRRQRERDRLPLQRAVQRGELPPDTDLDLAVDQLLGPIYYRVLVTGAPMSHRFTDHLVDQFLLQRRWTTPS
jgi:AcrR family transcriptional regulator